MNPVHELYTLLRSAPPHATEFCVAVLADLLKDPSKLHTALVALRTVDTYNKERLHGQ